MSTTVETKAAETKPAVKLPRQFVSFACFKVDPAWRRLSEAEKKKGKEEFA